MEGGMTIKFLRGFDETDAVSASCEYGYHEDCDGHFTDGKRWECTCSCHGEEEAGEEVSRPGS
jgi:hypothetical protein